MYFRMFDDTIEYHNVHKIEQNNDVYCVASGVPVVTNKHTMAISDFLLEIMGQDSNIWNTRDARCKNKSQSWGPHR